jgi:hypothetical protein
MRRTRGANASSVLAGIALAGAAVAGIVLAGCGNGAGGGTGAGTGARSTSSPDAATAAIVTCYRAHGDPSFPDPVYDPGDGRWHFAVSPGNAPLATQQACRHLFPAANASPPVPQAQFQKLVRLAECLRSHGVPTWPDPDPAGSFGLPPSLQSKTPAFHGAATACLRYWPSGGLNVHAVP